MILDKLKDLSELRLENSDLTIAMLNGAFDLFHISHLNLIKSAKTKCDVLVVCVSSDDSIRNGKGKDRPIIPQKDRAELVDSIRYVDYVFLNNDINNSEFNKWPGYHLRPDLIVSGDERWYHTDARVKELGIESLVVLRGTESTTKILKRSRS